MRLLEMIREKAKQVTGASEPSAKGQDTVKKARPEHGFLDAVKEEIGASKASPDVTVEELYQDLQQRKQEGVNLVSRCLACARKYSLAHTCLCSCG